VVRLDPVSGDPWIAFRQGDKCCVCSCKAIAKERAEKGLRFKIDQSASGLMITSDSAGTTNFALHSMISPLSLKTGSIGAPR